MAYLRKHLAIRWGDCTVYLHADGDGPVFVSDYYQRQGDTAHRNWTDPRALAVTPVEVGA